MATLDARPQSVALFSYGGDTLSFNVLVSDYAVVAGQQWNGQVRADPEATAIDATFTITPPSGAGQPATVSLDAATTARLADSGQVARVRQGSQTLTVKRYEGVWDLQVSSAGADPVRTLVRGPITIDKDVTRVAP